MRLSNDSPSFIPVHPQIRAIGPRDLHLAKGRGHTFQDDNATDEVVGVFFKRGTPEVDLFLTGILCPKRSAASLTRSALVSFAGWHLPILLQPQTTTSLRFFCNGDWSTTSFTSDEFLAFR